MKEISLRSRQEAAINLLRDAFGEGYRKVILQAPCSFGKTRLAASIIKSVIEKGKRVYFICDQINLIEQSADAFKGFDIPLGIIQANNPRTDYSQPLQVCSIQTLANRKNLPHADIVISDEVHVIYKAQIELMEKWNNIRFIGLTGTAYTDGLGKVWDKLVVGGRVPEMIKEGALTPLEEYGSSDNFDAELKKMNIEKIKTDEEVSRKMDKQQLNGEIVNNWKLLARNRATLCFTVDITHSKRIVKEFNNEGINALHIDHYNSLSEREEAFKLFESGKIKVLSSVGLLVKGIDLPFVGCLILARRIKSLIAYVQILGRGQRTFEGKKDCIVIDCGNNIERHGYITDPLPELLSMGSKKEAGGKKEKEEPKATKCKKCRAYRPPKVHVCPKCGFAPERQSGVENTNEKLVKLKKVDTVIKNQWYGMLLYYVRSKKWSDGAASHMYKDKFKVWPHKKTGVHPTPPNEEVKKYITYCNIKRGKSKSWV